MQTVLSLDLHDLSILLTTCAMRHQPRDICPIASVSPCHSTPLPAPSFVCAVTPVSTSVQSAVSPVSTQPLLCVPCVTMPPLSVYWTASRPWSFPVTICAMGVGGALAYAESAPGTFSFFNFFLSLLGGLLAHAAANFINTYSDYEKGYDKKDSSDDRSLVDGLLTPQQIYRSIVFCIAGGVSVAVYMIYGLLTRPPPPFALSTPLIDFLLLTAGGFLIGYAYTGPPFYWKYKGLGDILVLLGYGPFLVCGAYFCQQSCLPSLRSLWFSMAPGLLTEVILHVNNTRDQAWDKQCGAVTLPMRLGPHLSRAWFIFLFTLTLTTTLLPALTPHTFLPHSGSSSGGIGSGFSWSQLLFLSPLVLLPTIVDLVKRYDNKQFKDLCPRCGELAGKFGVLETIAIVAWRWSQTYTAKTA